ncbi:MAG: hypothetical protein ACJ76N_27745 [Thermoanaerobaculia bacterium]
MSWEQESWTIENCQIDLGLITDDVLTFENDNNVKSVIVHRAATPSFSWGTWNYSTNGYLAQVTRSSGGYGIALNAAGKLTCSPIATAPAFFIAGSLGDQNGTANAAAGSLSQQAVSAVGGIVLGTTAATLAGAPLWGGLLAAGVTALGYAGSLYLQRIVGEEDDPFVEGQGSSWTAQGGSGGSGLYAGGAEPQLA